MKKTLLTLVLALVSLSALAGKTAEVKQETIFKPYDNSQSFVARILNKQGGNSCLSSCRFQKQLCVAYNPLRNCQIQFERCVEACFN